MVKCIRCLVNKADEYRRLKPHKRPIRKHRFSGEIYRHNKVLPVISPLSRWKCWPDRKKLHSKLLPKIYWKNPTYFANFSSLSDKNKEWILEYLSGGKGIIPYKKIKSHEDLKRVPEGEFFSKSELKNEIISDQDYENVKKFWQLLRLTKLSDLNTMLKFRE